MPRAARAARCRRVVVQVRLDGEADQIVTEVMYLFGGTADRGERRGLDITGNRCLVPDVWDVVFDQVLKEKGSGARLITLRLDDRGMGTSLAGRLTGMLEVIGHELRVHVEAPDARGYVG